MSTTTNTSSSTTNNNTSQPSYPSASLYVGDLHPEVNEAALYEMFSETGPIVSIRVCRDAMTRKSLGYAYVNFQQGADAEKAINELNFASLNGRPIRIMWSQRDPSLRRSGLGNIFIKNLEGNVHTKDLYDIFKRFGRILSCKVSYSVDKEGTRISNGYGFVHFEKQEDADKAVAKVNGVKINGKQIFVGPFLKRSERPNSSKDDVFTNVYIKNLSKDCDDDKLREIFEQYGKVQNAAVMKDPSGQSKGFGFVNFFEHEDAVKAVEGLDGQPTGSEDKTYTVCRAQTRDERRSVLADKFEKLRMEEQKKRPQGTNLHVRNLSEETDDEALRGLFEGFGEIESVRVMRDPKKGVSRGFGFVCFKNVEDAQKAMTEMNNKMIGGKPLFVALHQKKQTRQRQIENQLRRGPIQMTAMRGAPPGFMGYPQFQAYPAPMYGMPWGGQKGVQPQVQPQKNSRQEVPFHTMLAQLPVEQQKQQIGNRLYPIVAQTNRELAGKITGMLLEMDVSDLLHYLENLPQLNEKIRQAESVFQRHQQQQQQQLKAS